MIQWECNHNDDMITLRQIYVPQRTASSMSALPFSSMSMSAIDKFEEEEEEEKEDITRREQHQLHHPHPTSPRRRKLKLPPRKSIHSTTTMPLLGADWEEEEDEGIHEPDLVQIIGREDLTSDEALVRMMLDRRDDSWITTCDTADNYRWLKIMSSWLDDMVIQRDAAGGTGGEEKWEREREKEQEPGRRLPSLSSESAFTCRERWCERILRTRITQTRRRIFATMDRNHSM